MQGHHHNKNCNDSIILGKKKKFSLGVNLISTIAPVSLNWEGYCSNHKKCCLNFKIRGKSVFPQLRYFYSQENQGRKNTPQIKDNNVLQAVKISFFTQIGRRVVRSQPCSLFHPEPQERLLTNKCLLPHLQMFGFVYFKFGKRCKDCFFFFFF